MKYDPKVIITPKNNHIVFVQTPKESKTFSLELIFNAGSKYGAPGLAHLLEHCVFLSTSKKTRDQVERALLEVGGEYNAFTSKDAVGFSCSGLASSFKKGLEILSEIAFKPTFDEGVAKEKEVVMAEIAPNYNDRGELIDPEAICEEMLYGKIGGLEVGQDISPYGFSELHNYAKERFSKQNCHVSVAGALTEAEVVSAVDKIFGKVSDEHLFNKRLLTVAKGIHSRYVQDPGAGDYDVMLQIPVMEDSGPPIALLQRFVAYTLGDGEISPLFGNARKQGLVYRLHSLLDHHCDADVFAISFGTGSDFRKVHSTIKMIKNQLEIAKEYGIPPDDLRLFKQSFLFHLYNLSQSPDCVRSVASDEYLSGNKMLPIEKQIKLIKDLTIPSYKYLLQSLTKNSNKAIAIVGPADGLMAAKQMKKIVKLVKEIN